MDNGDWRGQLQPESRQRILNKMMDTLKRHLPVSDQQGLRELEEIAQRLEEKILTAATSQSDYLRKISLTMLTMETKSQNTMANNFPNPVLVHWFNWRENQPIMDTSNWRDQLQPETRLFILNNLMDQIKLGSHPSDHDESLELQKIAQSVEQKSYAGATSQSDYLDKISSKMLLLQKAREREWRYLLHPDSRQRIINKMADTLRVHHLVSGLEEGSQEIWRIAQRIEEKILNVATSQSEYRRKIYLEMLRMETNPKRCLGQPSNQLGSDNEPANPVVDTNLRMQSSRSKRRPSWTRDYHMG